MTDKPELDAELQAICDETSKAIAAVFAGHKKFNVSFKQRNPHPTEQSTPDQ